MISCIKTLLFFTLTFVTINVTAQNGYTLLDSCYENSNGYVEFTRTFLVTTDSGSFHVEQFKRELDSVWTTTDTTAVVLCNILTSQDNFGRVLETNYYLNDSLNWNISRRTTFGYDSNNHLTDSVVQVDSSNVLVNSYSWHREFDSFGNLILKETKHWSSGQWLNNSREEWYFDVMGRDTLHVNFAGDSLNWLPYAQMRRIFDSNGIIDSMSYSWDGTSWNNQHRNQFSYQAALQDTLELSFNGNGILWDSSTAIRKTYDSFGNRTNSIQQNFVSSVWENYFKAIYTYDLSNRVVLETRMIWADSLWENSNQTIFTYSGIDAVDRVYQLWVDTVWVCESFTYNDYTYGQEVSGVFGGGDCNSRNIDSDETRRYDSLGHLIYSATDGHAGQSQGSTRYYYEEDFLYLVQNHSTSMGGLTHDLECYYYKPLTITFANFNFEICSGDSLSININGGVEPYTIRWYINDSLETNPSSDPTLFFPEVSGEYSVLVSDSLNNYFTQSIPVDVSVGVELGMDKIVCSDALVSLAAGQFETYVWQDGSTDSLFIASSPAQLADTIEYWVEVTDSSGCISRDSVSVVFEICIGVDELSDKLTQVFPNPVLSGEEFTIKGNVKADRITLANLSGEIVQELNIDNSGIYKLELEPGIYFLTIYTNEKMVVQKLIIL